MSDSFAEAYENAKSEIEKMSFSEKLKLIRSTALLHYHPNFIKFNGYVTAKTDFAIGAGEDEYYVYLWKHMDGDIFYVGSGKGERYRDKNNRQAEFYKHIDKGDAVVYVVLCGVDLKTARFYERYLSGSLSLAEFPLANRDNNVFYIGEGRHERWLKANKSTLANELTHKIEDLILNKVLFDNDFSSSHFYEIQTFKKECGDTYFSSKSSGAHSTTEVG
jgi:hypothetical protein